MSNEIKDLAHVRDPACAPLAFRLTRSQRRLGPGESLEQPLDSRHPLAQLAHIRPQAAEFRPNLLSECPEVTPELAPQGSDLARQSLIDGNDLLSQSCDLLPETPDLFSQTCGLLPTFPDLLPQTSDLLPQSPYAGHYDRSHGNGGDDDGDEFLAQTFHVCSRSRQRDCSTGDSDQMYVIFGNSIGTNAPVIPSYRPCNITSCPRPDLPPRRRP